MTTTIAISGKGGTGKTTLAALLILHLLDQAKTPILAVDADPNSNLNQLLGIELQNTIGDIREDMLRQLNQLPPSMPKSEYLEYKIRESLVESKGFDLLAMGRPEGPGCYCYPNQILREAIDRLSNRYRYVVMDCEAGLEHISRRTTRDIDIMLITSDPTIRSLQTAKRISELAEQLQNQIKNTFLIINRVTNHNQIETLKPEIKKLNLNLLGAIPEDELIKNYDLKGQPLTNLPIDFPIKQITNQIFTNIILTYPPNIPFTKSR